jgi:hypothetical protein
LRNTTTTTGRERQFLINSKSRARATERHYVVK